MKNMVLFMHMNTFEHKTTHDLPVTSIKRLLAAWSFMYDGRLTNMGLDPSKLRAMNFSNTELLESETFERFQRQYGKDLLGNQFLQYTENHDEGRSWTPTGDRTYHYSTINLRMPFQILEVKFEEEFDFHCGTTEYTYVGESNITPLDAFRKYGTMLFVLMADQVDWDTIIGSF